MGDPLAFVFVGGGVLGGLHGARLAKSLSDKKGALTSAFSALIFAVEERTFELQCYSGRGRLSPEFRGKIGATERIERAA